MKHLTFYLGFAAVLVASCSTREMDLQTPIQNDVAFRASFEQPVEAGTRVYAGEDLFLRWNAEDRISIFNKNTTNLEYMFTGETDDNAGGFRKVDTGVSVDGKRISHVVSVYPYQEATEISNSEAITVTLPAEQDYNENSFGVGANTMVSVSSGNVLQYKNVGGYLVLKLYGEGVTVSSISLSGNNREILAGKATVTMPLDGTPKAVLADDSSRTITLNCATPVELGATEEESQLFWFVVPPVTFSKGFTITVYDPNGGPFTKSTSSSISIERNMISKIPPMEAGKNPNNIFVSFEDSLFKKYCVSRFDTNKDGEISLSEANEVITIDVERWSITSLRGIEHFINLTILHCNQAKLTSLDVSQNAALRELWCDDNSLTVLDVTHNPKLEDLRCAQNRLTILDVSGNTLLKQLECNDNQLVRLDLSKNTYLTSLHCENNRLASLDLSSNTKLTELHCENNQLASLDLGRHSKLTALHCDNNRLTNLDVSNSTALTELFCQSNQLTGIDVSNKKALRFLWVSDNQLTNLDTRNNPELVSLYCYNNQLTDIDVSHNTALVELQCQRNKLTSLDVSKNTALSSMQCQYNHLTRLDVSNNRKFCELRCSNNPYLLLILLQAGQSIAYLEYDKDIATLCYKPEVVDMGTSVKWASFNLSSRYVMHNTGDYYAWGETMAYYRTLSPLAWKDGNEAGYMWTNYKWGDGSRLTKYNTLSSYGIVDNKTILDPQDDAAHFALGDGWRMPTREEFEELLEVCTVVWGNQWGGNKGFYLTSKITGKELSFYMAGYYSGTDNAAATQGYYWSSSLDPDSPNHAFYLFFDPYEERMGMTSETLYRSAGFSIRPVYAE